MRAHLSSLPRGHHPYLLAALVIAAMLPARAAAQPAEIGPPDPDDDPAAWTVWELAPLSAGERSPPVATALSAGVTLAASMAVLVGASEGDGEVPLAGLLGVVVGPSVGHWYGGRLWTRGTSLRLGGVIVGGAGLAVVAGCVEGRELPCDLGGEALITGTVLYVAGTVYEIVTAPRTAAEPRGGQPRATRLVVTALHGNDKIVPGIAMLARF